MNRSTLWIALAVLAFFLMLSSTYVVRSDVR